MVPAPHDSLPPDAFPVIERIRSLEAEGASDAAISGELRRLKAIAKGRYTGALRALWPDLNQPRSKAKAYHDRARRPEKVRAPRARLGDDESADLFASISWILRLPSAERAAAWRDLSTQTLLSVRSLQEKGRQIAAGEGLDAVRRKVRKDRQRSRAVPSEAEQYFLDLRKRMPGRRMTLLAKLTRQKFPHITASDAAFRRIAERDPKARTKSDQQWRADHLPTGQWEPAEANQVWTFDFTQADAFVWDGRRAGKPYRPYLSAIIDERTRSILWAVYTKEQPSLTVLQGMILEAILPKHDRFPSWIQHGMPQTIRCDNGKVQISNWLQEVCSTLCQAFGTFREVSHTPVRSPWAQGHIERFYGEVHSDLEARLDAYCGRSPAHRGEIIDRPWEHERQYHRCRTLDELNELLRSWIVYEYHEAENRTLQLSPAEAWQRFVPQVIDVPPRDFLYTTLLQRGGTRRVSSRGQVSYQGVAYGHAVLQGYDGVELELRWDPADISRVLLLDPVTRKEIVWADRVLKLTVGDPKDYAEASRQKKAAKDERKAIERAADILAGKSEEEREEIMERVARQVEEEERREKGIIRLPKRSRELQPEETEDDDLFSQMYPEIAARVEAMFGDDGTPGNGKHESADDPDDDGSGGKPLSLHGIEI